MNIKLRITSFVLALLTVSAMAASCSDKEDSSGTSKSDTTDGTSTTTATLEETTEVSQYEQRQLISDDLPENDFKGNPFRIGTASDKSYEIYEEEITGKNTSDAVYNRNQKINERFNTEIQAVILGAPYSDVKTHVLAGDKAYEITGFWNYVVYTPVSAGVVSNWRDVPLINFDKPWHNKLANDSATINGKLFAITSDLSISSLLYTYAMFYNVDLANQFGYSSQSLYDLVFSGQWTVDTFKEITSTIYVDVNGNSKKDNDDIHGYGFYLGLNPSDVWLAALDLTVTTTVNGELEVGFYNDKSVAAIEKIIDLSYNSDGSYIEKTDWRKIPELFSNGTIAFTQLYFGEAFDVLGDMENTYGILPLPKWDELQESYYTNAWDQFTVFAIPKTSEDYEFIGTIFEALCAETYKTVYPEYYDVALKSRYSSDPTVAEIVDIVMAGRKFEFSFQFGDVIQRIPYLFRDMLYQNNTNLASKFTSIEKTLKKSLEKINGYYQ